MMKNSQGKLSTIETITKLFPFLWKKKDVKLRFSIVIALALIPIAIALNISVPFIFREAVNLLSSNLSNNKSIIILVIISYGLFWTASSCAEKIREMVFFRPVSSAITDYSIAVFKHIHSLSLDFHLSRETGKITGAIERSQLAIAMIVTNVLFRILPVIIEVVIVFAILWHLYNVGYGLLLIGILFSYLMFSVITSNLILKYQRNWDNTCLKVNSRIVDSLLNIETGCDTKSYDEMLDVLE